MQETKKEALSLSKYFVSLPSPARTVIYIFFVAFAFGVLFSAVRAGALSPGGLATGGMDGIVLLAFPAILSSVGLYFLRRKAIFRRAVFLGLLTAVCYGLFYLASFALAGIMPFAGNLVFAGFGISFVLWYFILLLAFDFRKSAVLFATMQLIIFALFFLARTDLASSGVADALVKMYAASFVFLAALYGMFYLVSAPMKKNLGISSMDALSMFLSQWLYGEKDLEEVFAEIGEDAETLVWVGRFSGKKNDALFVVPYIHYGPFGNLGGSEFTCMISDALSSGGKEVFVFHGTTTHDFNPVTSSEIKNVVGACRKAIAKIKMRDAKMAISMCRVGSVRCSAMRINDSAFLSFSRAPLTTEDVNLGIGLAILEKAKRYVGSACVVDEHNAETGDITSVEVGSPIGFDMLRAAEGVFAGKRRPQERFLFGTASCQLPIDTLGKNGLKLALFARGKSADALLLADSNSVTPEFRDELLAAMKEAGRDLGFSCRPEIMTTDTHQINTVKGVLHPLGVDDKGEVVSAVRRLFSEAASRLETVKYGCADGQFEIRIFGTGQSTEIASTINSVVSVMKLALPAILLGTILLIIWAISKM